jgi:hypothetical protein
LDVDALYYIGSVFIYEPEISVTQGKASARARRLLSEAPGHESILIGRSLWFFEVIE